MSQQVPEELSFSIWRETAWGLFRDDFIDDKEYFAVYREPVDVYMELARRVVNNTAEIALNVQHDHPDIAEAIHSSVNSALSLAAYKLMYRAYMTDAISNNTDELSRLSLLSQSKKLE